MEYWDFLAALFHAFGRFLGVAAVLMLIVIVHELGHYFVGRLCGIQAAVFSVGFGHELWGYKDKRGTRWRLAVLPLGGYVRFVGDDSADSLSPAHLGKKVLQQGSFAAANAWKRVATVLAGPLFNIILAALILAFMAFYFGKFSINPVVSKILPNSVAEQSGLRVGDRFIAMNGEPVRGFEDIARYVMGHEGEAIVFTVERGGAKINLTVTPKEERVDDGFGNTIHVGRMGIVSSVSPENQSKKAYGLWGALGEGARDTLVIVRQTGQYLGKLLQGRGDRCQLSGPVRTAQIAWKISDVGIWALVQLAAFLSVGIGLFNLLPLPPLDGGHLLFYVAEGISGRAVPASVQEKVFRLGWVVIILFTVFAILNNSIPC